ncbi:MAG: GTP 3',8-cyclase MoaA [Actinobacteria bacterium]|nr:GTP 3',8-cyclase MoaA [Cyanobacteriota bacterium]MCL5772394.1 GTP 3',8-cyclase MoaA [Actinomycetota bacterium]
MNNDQILIDSYKRKIDYLRLSITDRCNLRCIYCMPENGIRLISRNEILTFEEILKIVQILVELGIKKIRITGGEPLLRDNFLDLIKETGKIEGIEDISLTTNGILLDKYLCKLYELGVKRINISLDSLDPIKYREITRGGDINKVLGSISNAIIIGFKSVKINIVITERLDSKDIRKFINLTLNNPIDIRFIEMMPVTGSDDSIECSSIGSIINSNITKLKNNTQSSVKEIFSIMGKAGKYFKVKEHAGYGPAIYYRIEGYKGNIGFILNDKNYCRYCNRIRLTSKGAVKLCLFSEREFDIKRKIRGKASTEEIKTELINFIKTKPENRECNKNFNNDGIIKISNFMNQIGG